MTNRRLHIDRCLCTGRTFAELAAQARRDALDLDALMLLPRGNGGCGASSDPRCGLCRPYLAESLRSGQTVFHQILTGRR